MLSLPALRFTAAQAQTGVAPAEARAIAKDASSMASRWWIATASIRYFVDRQNPEFKAPWNKSTIFLALTRRPDTALQTPNSDTPYSWVGRTCAPSPSFSHRAAD